MRWDRIMLEETLSEARKYGEAVLTMENPTPKIIQNLRNALYNSAKSCGEHQDFEFLVEGTHVVVKLREKRKLRRIA